MTVAVSEAPAVVVPPVGGATMTALPSALQDLARFFLNLAGDPLPLKRLTVLRAWLLLHLEWGLSCALLLLVEKQSHLVLRLRFLLVWVVLLLLPLLCPARPAVSSVRRSPAPAGVAVARPAMGPVERQRSVLGVVLLPLVLLPLVLLLDTGRGPIGRLRSLPKMPRAETSLARAGCAPGGTSGDSRPAPVGDRSPRPGPSGWTARSSARAERYRSGVGGRRSPSLSGVADDDRSSAFDAVGFDRDDSFRSVLGLIRSFHRYSIGLMQDFSCIDLWVDVGDLSGIPPAHLSLDAVASGRH